MAFQPAEPVKVEEEQHGGNGPGERITEYYSLNNWI